MLTVTIVGAGVVGSVLAYRLAQAGHRVTVVEGMEPGGGTTSRSFAWLNGYDKHPEAYHRLNVLSMADHEDLAAELRGDWLHLTGCLHWARKDDPEAERLVEVISRMREWGTEVEELTPAQAVAGFEPGLCIDCSAVETVYRVALEGWLDAPRLATEAIRAAEEAGARVIRGTVVDLMLSDVAVEGVVLGDGERLESDVVVNAAGPKAAEVAAMAGLRLQLRRAPGLMLRIPGGRDLRGVVRSSEIFLRPAPPCHVLAHLYQIDEFAGSPAGDPNRRKALEGLHQAAKRILPSVDAMDAEPLVGERPMPADGLPVIGYDPRAPGLYSIVTHSGVTLSARLARLVARDLIEPVPELDLYRPRWAMPPGP